ncbi:small guanosine triphosphatase Rsg1 [Paratrimastix pyriformis]|uniref:Ciliogenesis and planar polarity effector 2 n=1 Tax=Paratrimastix pyriformis TaxID=342808 RepID=A0ABQ8UHQ8_9EUKA|nr:small guanosine triphosphatase Rsg1 [Paratrimastix pyriformis]
MELDKMWLESSEGKEVIAKIRSSERGFLLPPPILAGFSTRSFHVYLRGNQRTGKTSLVAALAGTTPPTEQRETLGRQITEVYWPINHGLAFHFYLHEASQASLDSSSFGAVDAEIFVFRLTERTSLLKCAAQIKQQRGRPAILVGTFLDLIQRSQVTNHECQAFAASNDVPLVLVTSMGPAAAAVRALIVHPTARPPLVWGILADRLSSVFPDPTDPPRAPPPS